MTLRVLRARDRVASVWKNGGGVTREIAVYPAGAGLDAFDWRVSTATVSAGGPFSLFPGVDRVLAVVEGRLTLRFEGGATLDLSPASPLAVFPGDVPVCAQTPPGPVTDLNVMTRRGRVRAAVTRLDFEGERVVAAARRTLILALHGGLRVEEGGAAHELGRFDAVLIEQAAGEPIRLEAAGSASAYRIDLHQVNQTTN
ncbi:MAG: HutD/Ves family protein [Caulobacteraceae bacterium]